MIQPVGVCGQQVFGQAHRFFAKDQEHVVLVVDVVVGLCALTRQESKVGIPVNVHEGVEALIGADLQVLPIVQSGPLQSGVGDLEPKGLDEVQGGSGSETQPTNIACIGGDLRLYKYNVESHLLAGILEVSRLLKIRCCHF